jgi:hypothetical protein
MTRFQAYPPTGQIKKVFAAWMQGVPRSKVRTQITAKPGYSLRETFVKLLGVPSWAAAKAKRQQAVKAARQQAKKERAA